MAEVSLTAAEQVIQEARRLRQEISWHHSGSYMNNMSDSVVRQLCKLITAVDELNKYITINLDKFERR